MASRASGAVKLLPPLLAAFLTVGQFGGIVAEGCQRFHCSVTSWCRTEAHNQAVGGVPDSRHLECLAADLLFDSEIDKAPAVQWFRSRGLQVIPYETHIHVEPITSAEEVILAVEVAQLREQCETNTVAYITQKWEGEYTGVLLEIPCEVVKGSRKALLDYLSYCSSSVYERGPCDRLEI